MADGWEVADNQPWKAVSLYERVCTEVEGFVCVHVRAACQGTWDSDASNVFLHPSSA